MGGKSNKYAVESLMWFLAGVIVFGLTYEFDEFNPSYEFGPAAWPRALLIGIMVAAVLLWRIPGAPIKTIVDRATESSGGSADKGQESESAVALSGRAKLHRAAIFAVPLAYVFFMDMVGFLLVTPFFLIGYMYLLGYRNWRRLIPLSVAIYCAVVSLFIVLMSTPLPQGVGFFHSLNGYILNFLQ